MARHSSTFSFFARYQRIILYTAGIFALVSFSITGALQSMFSDMFRPPILTDTIVVNGDTVKVTEEDQRIGTALAQRGDRFDPTVVMPNLVSADPNQDMSRVYAALRRAAITYGIGVSEVEVDRAIAEGIEIFPADPTQPIETASDLAAVLRYSSLEAYRSIIREAMRIGTLVRLESLAIDASDAVLVADLLEQQEMIQLRVASLDSQVLEAEFKKVEVSDTDLQTWIDELSDNDRRAFGYVDSNRARLRIVALKPVGFDATPYSEELGDRTISDAEVQTQYQLKRDEFYKLAKPEQNPDEDPPVQEGDGYRPLDDALTEEIRKRIAAREIMRALWAKVQKEQGDALLPLNETRTVANQRRLDAEDAVATAQTALDADPESAALTKALEGAQTAFEAVEKTHQDAGQAIDEARAVFDMEAAFGRVLGDRDPSVFVFLDSGDKPETSERLGEIEGIGTWSQSWAGTSHQKVGELSSSVQETADTLFHYAVTAVQTNPLKPLEEIKDEVRADYYVKKADEQRETKSETFEAALLRLARARRADDVAALEAAKAKELEDQIAKWREDTSQKRDAAQLQVDKLSGDQASGAYQRWRSHLDSILAELGDEDGKRNSLDEGLSASLEDDIEEEAHKAYQDVIAEAAAEVGFEIEELVSLPRNLNRKGAPKDNFSSAVQFLFFARSSDLVGLEAGDTTGLLEDSTNRRVYMAVCMAVKKASLADFTRRDLVAGRKQAASARITAGVIQSYSIEALQARLQLKGPADGDGAEIKPK